MAQFKHISVPASLACFDTFKAELTEPKTQKPSRGSSFSSSTSLPAFAFLSYMQLLSDFDTPTADNLIRSTPFEDFLISLNQFQQTQRLESGLKQSDRRGSVHRLTISASLKSPRLARMSKNANDGLHSPMASIFAASPSDSPMCSDFSVPASHTPEVPKIPSHLNLPGATLATASHEDQPKSDLVTETDLSDPRNRRSRRKGRVMNWVFPSGWSEMEGRDGVDTSSNAPSVAKPMSRKSSRVFARPRTATVSKGASKGSIPFPDLPSAEREISNAIELSEILPDYDIWNLFMALDSILPSFGAGCMTTKEIIISRPGASILTEQQTPESRLIEAARLVSLWIAESMSESCSDGQSSSSLRILNRVLKKSAQCVKQQQTAIRRVVNGIITPVPFKSPTVGSFLPKPESGSNSKASRRADASRDYLVPGQIYSSRNREVLNDFVPGKSLLSYTAQEIAGKLVEIIYRMAHFNLAPEQANTCTRFSVVSFRSSLDVEKEAENSFSYQKLHSLLRTTKANQKFGKLRNLVGGRKQQSPKRITRQRAGTDSTTASGSTITSALNSIFSQSVTSSSTGLSSRSTFLLENSAADMTEEAVIKILQAVNLDRSLPSEDTSDGIDSLLMLYFVLAFRSVATDIFVLAGKPKKRNTNERQAGFGDSGRPSMETETSDYSRPVTALPNYFPTNAVLNNASAVPVPTLGQLSNLCFRVGLITAQLQHRKEVIRQEESQVKWWKPRGYRHSLSILSGGPLVSPATVMAPNPSPVSPAHLPNQHSILGESSKPLRISERRKAKLTPLIIPPVVSGLDTYPIPITSTDGADNTDGAAPKGHAEDQSYKERFVRMLTPSSPLTFGPWSSKRSARHFGPKVTIPSLPTTSDDSQPQSGSLIYTPRTHQRDNSVKLPPAPAQADSNSIAVLSALLSDPLGRATVLVDTFNFLRQSSESPSQKETCDTYSSSKSYRDTDGKDSACSTDDYPRLGARKLPDLEYACTMDRSGKKVLNLTFVSRPSAHVPWNSSRVEVSSWKGWKVGAKATIPAR